MLERRTYKLLEIRAEDDNGRQMRVKGHAAVFNQKSEEIFGFREIVVPGAFKRTIQEADVRALWNHDPNFVLGRNKSGTLSLREDKIGLFSEIDFPDTTFARDLFISIKRGDVDQMSFGFRTITDKWHVENGEHIRELVDVELFDVSPVTFPAYPQTDISARFNAVSEELRSYYHQKMTEGSDNLADVEKEKFLSRMKNREDFLSRRAQTPDPYDLREIVKKAQL